MATQTKERPATFGDTPAGDPGKLWQQQIIDQLADLDPADFTHIVITRNGETASLVSTYPDEDKAIIAAAEYAEGGNDEEVSVVAADELHAFIDRDQALDGTDPDKGKLFDLPRVAIVLDEADPSVIKVAFSGGIELDRAKPDDVEFYNQLKAGQTVHLAIEAHVKGANTTHRRDGNGDVDAIVQTKSLVIHSLETE